jgi:DNA-binding LacI/PurR family transcriptional regulator
VRYEPQVDRWEGFAAALDRFGLAVPEPNYTQPEDLAALWLDDAIADGTTVILVEAVSLLRVLAAIISLRGLSVPRDISVVLLVDDPGSEVGPGPWACMRIPATPWAAGPCAC